MRVDPEDTAPQGPCEPQTPQVLSAVDARVGAVDGQRVWLSALPNLAVGYVDITTGTLAVVAEQQFGVSDMAAQDGDAWWTTPGLSDSTGQLVRSPQGSGATVLHGQLFQPGGLQVDATFVYYAEFTNSGSLRDERRGRVLRITRQGTNAVELATELGVVRHTALSGDHIYWSDWRRDHLARVRTDGTQTEEVVAEAARAILGSHGNHIYYAVDTTLLRLDTQSLAIDMVATLPTGARRLLAFEEGVLLSLWYSEARVGDAVGFVPHGSSRVRELDPQGGYPAVGADRVVWSSVDEDGAPVLKQVCRDYLLSL